MAPDSNDACSWCGRALDPADSWLLAEPSKRRRAAFCRLEHIVPWAIRGAPWTPDAEDLAELPDAPVLLVRRRGGLERAEGFSTVDDVAAWAKAGGPWAA